MKNLPVIFNNQHSDTHTVSAALCQLRHDSRSKPLPHEQRYSLLKGCIRLLQENKDELCEAYSQDFGHRAHASTLLSDILGSIEALKHSLSGLKKWSQDEPRESPFPDTCSYIQYRPLGVVGVMSPWNFPLVLTFGPLSGILAAGNRAIIKPSEFTPSGSRLLCHLISEYFPPDEILTVQGDAGVSAFFASLPLDHLVFTGSSATGRHVMRAAAENLTPVTLELGGKSPVIISESANLKTAAERIMTAKAFNAGQICIAPDYVMVPARYADEFIGYAVAFLRKSYGSYLKNPDFSSIINAAHSSRLNELIDDATKNCERIISASEELDLPSEGRIIPRLILNPSDNSRIMQEEIFGPLLPIITYEKTDECINRIRNGEKPLALYYFGQNENEFRELQCSTDSGALVFNDVMSHVLVHDLPFGGVGHSGMGAYHGEDGFRRFSHARAIFIQSDTGLSNLLMRAPFTDEKINQITSLINQP
ncbi:TPA: aldehyde dehydrogenase family protein [Enterobacter hormaechei subsp. xiangfangensis]|uniref:aldehyde dehydrogenase family protein n=1 Tax=Enterobacter hormaechei TaxID=158836 RepID=UPI0013E95644|nr:aldehyde dehydrogenase family protein [Enterobacter hormaechei]HAV1775792.1 aldehyde dehydrogenase family protein [Enterobacter hormaechei subsp. xiangfangensis]HDW0092840.1 aldehyde dehydrogenase family protein [Enterobacter hormaechei subsp. steigerwaltii]KAF6533468.1 aldehyde dehydrogenase family protein [Enterobacter hormaechei]KAF6533776.1 aldehyde dehydrogenase family protein [Enterobacter hormaechei]MCE1499765.1 aldehyde dehydrogenase family protein [Enterobacter hormaechei]